MIIPQQQLIGGALATKIALSTKKWLAIAFLPRLPLSVYTFAGLTILISSWVAVDIARDATLNNEVLTTDRKCQFSTFDYIIVGAGAAGMVVATRLANASTDSRVLLLEAGGEPHFLNNIPVLDFNLMNQPTNNWVYKSTPQKRSSGMCANNVRYARIFRDKLFPGILYGRYHQRSVTTGGKMLGGSTSSNFMLYARGHKEDFNRWAMDAEDSQWNYENLLPYFKKSEDYNGAYSDGPASAKYHGKGGLLNVATLDHMPGVDDLLAAAVEKGYRVGDYNGENQEVFSKMDVTTQNGWRESTYRAFYKDTGRPLNLCIRKFAHVTKIQFEIINGKPKAVGVVYQRQLQTRTVRATKEVILSGGTYGSAKLLLLSGVGPAEHLDDLGIPLVRDLPVGRHLQDHTYTIVGPFLKAPSTNPKSVFNSKAVFQYLRTGTGPLAAPTGFAGTGFFQSPYAQPAYPDLQIIQFSISLYNEIPAELNRILGLDEEKVAKWFHPFHKNNVENRFLVLLLGRPKSVGRLTLASTNPNENPIVDPNHFSHSDDFEALFYGFKKMLDLYENSTSLNTPLFPNPVPGCENEQFKSDDYYRCVIRHVSGSFYHAVGTCALGRVVDNRLRVKGIDGLRVIDASVMPRVPNANTQAASIMIGEKGADLIRLDNNM